MLKSTHLALGTCTAAYALAGVGCYLLFSGHPSEDVLTDFQKSRLAPLIGSTGGFAVEAVVKSSYLVVLLCHSPVIVFGLRDLLLELIFSGSTEIVPWTSVTLGILGATYLTSVLFPSVWTFLSLIGATAALSLAYVIPAALMVTVRDPPESQGQKRLAWGIIGVCALVAVVSVSHTLAPGA